MIGRWNQSKLFKEIINDHQTCINWCTNVGYFLRINYALDVGCKLV